MSFSNAGNSVAFINNTGKVEIADIGDPASVFAGQPGETYQGGNGVSVIAPTYGQLVVPAAGKTCAANFTVDLSKLTPADKELVSKVQDLTLKMQKYRDGVPSNLKSIEDAKALNAQADALRTQINEFNIRNVGTSDLNAYTASVNAADAAYIQAAKESNFVRQILQQESNVAATDFNDQNVKVRQQEKDLLNLQKLITQANLQVDIDNAKSVEDFKSALDQASARITTLKADPKVTADLELVASYDRALKAIQDIQLNPVARTPESIASIQAALDNATQKLQAEYEVALAKYNDEVANLGGSFTSGADVVSASEYETILSRLGAEGIQKTNPLGEPHILEIDGVSLAQLLKDQVAAEQQGSTIKNVISVKPVNAGGSNNGANGPSIWVYSPEKGRNDYVGDSGIFDTNGDGGTTEVELTEELKAKFPGQYDDLTADKLRELSTDSLLVIDTKEGPITYKVSLGVEAGAGPIHSGEKAFAIDLSEMAAFLKTKGLTADDVDSVSLKFMTTPGSWGSVGDSIEIKSSSIPVPPTPPVKIELPEFAVKTPVPTAEISYPSVTFKGVTTPAPNCPPAALQGPSNLGIPNVAVPTTPPITRLPNTGFDVISQAAIAIGAIGAGWKLRRIAKKNTATQINGATARAAITSRESLPKALQPLAHGPGRLRSKVCFTEGNPSNGQVVEATRAAVDRAFPQLAIR